MHIQIEKCSEVRPVLIFLGSAVHYSSTRGKAIPVTDRGGPYSCEKSRLPSFLDNRLIDGGEFVSLTHRPLFTPQADSWYSFLLEC
jgi:hypothetical protein